MATAEGSGARAEIRRLLELAALTGLALVQPLLDVLGRSPETFVFRRVDGADLVVFAVAVALVPALVLWVIGLLSGLLGPRVRRAVHLGALAVLLAIAVLVAPQVRRHPVRPGRPAGGRRGRRPRRAGLPPLHRGPPLPRLPVRPAARRRRGVPLLLPDLGPAQRRGVRHRRRPRHDHAVGGPGGRRVPDRSTPRRRRPGRRVPVPELRPAGGGRPLVPELHDRQQLHPPGRAGAAQRGGPGRRPGPAPVGPPRQPVHVPRRHL